MIVALTPGLFGQRRMAWLAGGQKRRRQFIEHMQAPIPQLGDRR